jgi:hypothetical protein
MSSFNPRFFVRSTRFCGIRCSSQAWIQRAVVYVEGVYIASVDIIVVSTSFYAYTSNFGPVLDIEEHPTTRSVSRKKIISRFKVSG